MARSKKGRASTKRTATRTRERLTNVRNRPLRDLTEEALRKYFRDLNGHRPGDLYELVMGEVEVPLITTVMDFAEGNQSRAAEILGINRATLRKKLKIYHIME